MNPRKAPIAALTLLFLGFLNSPAQTIDLREGWLFHAGDRPEYAQPDFDDSSWQPRTLPRAGRVEIGASWLRRRVDGLGATRGMAIAIGAASHCIDVYLDGRRLGGSGCLPGVDPPYFSPKVLPIPDDWLTPGRPFVLALRLEGRRNTMWAGMAGGALEDRGPYALGPLGHMNEAAEHSRLLMESRVSVASSILTWNSLGAAILLIALWLGNRSKWELWWFGCFQVAIGVVNVLQLQIFSRGFSSAAFMPALAAGYICFNFATHAAFAERPLRWPAAAAIAGGILAGVWLLPIFGIQPLAMILPAYWSLRRMRAARASDRWLAAAIFCYVLASLNSSANRLLPGLWPVPPVLAFGQILVSTVAFTNGLLSALMVLLLVIRLGEDWRQRQKLSSELEAGRTAQRLLLRQPDLSGEWRAQSICEPASEVGGDFYQFSSRPDGALLLVVGDVSGKGLEAAMVASLAVGAFRSSDCDSPAQALAMMNQALTGLGRGGFVTCCCARFDPGGEVTIANAGHPAPYANGQEAVLSTGLPLGLLHGAEYHESNVPGSAFTFVSDGVLEAENAQRELFGFDRAREMSAKSAREIADAARAWGQSDDITVVTVRRTG